MKKKIPLVVLNEGHCCAYDLFCRILPPYVMLQVDSAGQAVVLLKYLIPMWTLPWIGVIRDTIK